MSSCTENFFEDINGKKIEENVCKLFAMSNGPVDRRIINARKRTVLPELVQTEKYTGQTNVEESGEESEKVIEDPFEIYSDVGYGKHFRGKRKRNNDNYGLEKNYFTKLIDHDAGLEKSIEPKDAKYDEKGSRAEKLDLREDEFKKAERTVFVGSVPADIVSDGSLYAQFKKLFHNEKGLESIRFRSISFETPLPRKVAFIQQKLHKSRRAVNAYVVLKNKDSVQPICSRLNGRLFAGRHLRVDSVTRPAKHDNSRSVFVGNLHFEEDEETLWRHFSSCGEIEYVRIVRDSKTNIGKGFAYVQFKDFSNVNKALLLNGKQLESMNGKARNLRVSRCRNLKRSGLLRLNGSFDKLGKTQKSNLGGAKKVLSKVDAPILGEGITVEGIRASVTDSGSPSSILKRRKRRSKTGRVTKRSLAHRKKTRQK